MAQQQEEGQQQSAFPSPPAYYKLYSSTAEKSPPLPPKPIQGEYTQFGEIYSTEHVNPKLQGKKLFKVADNGTIDFRSALSEMNSELPYAFLELVSCLIDQPSEIARRLDDVGVILRNMYHLINAARPIQARETLKCLLEMQIQEKQECLETLRAERKEAESLVEEGLAALVSDFNQLENDM
eukprot:TRINITY_DN13474_c1_g1_i2.p1 TRINITY_DN13474_c1_g1~~TRINITY_DN13474_c1_g1_i2.p1  ORF type:complete len:182 (+),score=36.66 TRINITY_DN13474_c1_g1_i2:78-623(+)